MPTAHSSNRRSALVEACLTASAVVICSFFWVTLGFAQPPGTLPPPEAIRAVADPVERNDSFGGVKSSITPKMFLVLDDAGNPVAVPGMSFEKLDELLQLKDGLQQSARPYLIEALEVRGRVLATLAELTVTVRIQLGATGGKWVAVPLRMSNFHRTGPADISGVERYRMDLDDSDGGHVLQLESETPRSVVVAMRVVARVAPGPGSEIDFRLPDAPSTVLLQMPSPGVSASVVGQGDEVLITRPGPSETEVSVTGRGGDFRMRFGSQAPPTETRPVLESESKVVVDWLQADNTPLVTHEVSVRSLRGDLKRFDLDLPETYSLLQQPSVLGNGPFEIGEPIETGVVDSDESRPPASGGPRVLIGVSPLAGQGDSRVDISLATQLKTAGDRPGAKVTIRGIGVSDAIKQTGEIEVMVPRDYRLRWDSTPWVTGLWEQTGSEPIGPRNYRFRFERVPFELPIWLSARTQRLRVEGDYRLALFDSSAQLKLQLRTTGGVPDPRILPIEIGPWNVQSVMIGATATEIDADQNDGILEIDLSALPEGGANDRIEIVLTQSIQDDQESINLMLPRIIGDPLTIGVSTSTLWVLTDADYRFVADLTNCRGIGEVLRSVNQTNPQETISSGLGDTLKLAPAESATIGAGPKLAQPNRGPDNSFENRYSLPDISRPSQIKGFLVNERPGVSVLVEADLSIEGSQLVEVIHWTVYPRSRLRGRLPIVLTSEQDPLSGTNKVDESDETTDSASIHQLGISPLWSVTVDDSPAVLRGAMGGEYAILSESLSGGPHRIRFRRSRELPAEVLNASAEGSEAVFLIAGLALPRPAATDLSLMGPMSIRLKAEAGLELTSRDTRSRWSNDVSLPSMPNGDLPLRIRRTTQQGDISIPKAWLQTAVSRELQYDHLVATVQGGGTLRLHLANASALAKVRASVDGGTVDVIREATGDCLLRLGEPGTHVIAVELYQPRASRSLTEQIEPILGLEAGTEIVYWEVVTPRDDHLVWNSPALGQAMIWKFDRWHLHRQTLRESSELRAWAGGEQTDTRLPVGNRYLLVGADTTDLRIATMSRFAIWMLVGSAVLAISFLLTQYPALRNPFVAVLGSVLLGGLTWLLPDAAVLVAQVSLLAMLMVGTIAGLSHLLIPQRPTRVLLPGADRSSLKAKPPIPTFAPAGAGPALVSPAAVATRGSTAEVR